MSLGVFLSFILKLTAAFITSSKNCLVSSSYCNLNRKIFLGRFVLAQDWFHVFLLMMRATMYTTRPICHWLPWGRFQGTLRNLATAGLLNRCTAKWWSILEMVKKGTLLRGKDTTSSTSIKHRAFLFLFCCFTFLFWYFVYLFWVLPFHCI